MSALNSNNPNPPPQPTSPGDLARIRRRLTAIAARVRAVLVMRGVFVSIAALLALVIAGILIDYLLRLPVGVRTLMLIGLVAVAVRLWLKAIAPALRVRPSPTDIALRLEHRDPALRGLLASAVDMGHRQGEGDIDRSLTGAALATAARRLGTIHTRGLLRLNDLARAGGLFAVLALAGGVLAWQFPAGAEIGVRRVLAPWTQAKWPRRYAIADRTNLDARAIDIAVPVRALIGTPDSGDADSARAMVNWRLLDDDRRAVSDWSRTMLVPQRRRDAQSGIPIFEQLIDAQAAAARSEDTSFTLEYRIVTRDDTTGTRRIPLVRPPELVETTATIELPPYASPIAGSGLVRSGTLTSPDEDFVISPVLAGSRVELLWRFSKPVSAGEAALPEWVATIEEAASVEAFDQPTPDSVRLVMRAGASSSIQPAIVDASGIGVRTPIIVSLGVLEDRAPGAAITEPGRDEGVSSHATIELGAELSDDIGLETGSITATRAMRPGESAGAPAEPGAEPTTLVSEQLGAAQRVTLAHTLEIASLGVEPGDEVWVSAVAWDLRRGEASDRAGLTRSPERVLRILDDAELIEQIRQGLAPVRGAMRQLDEQQAALQEMLRAGNPNTAREQRGLTNRLGANARTLEQLSRTLDRNNLDDEALRSMLDDAASVLDEAAEQSERASEQVDRGQRQRAAQSQKAVRDRLGEMLSMLDRGQDSWMALRSVQQLRDELEALREDTQGLAGETAGKTMEQLSEQERAKLDRILERQLESAQDAREAMNTLDQSAQQLQENDPTQAEALRRAAQQGRAAQMEQKLREAAQQIGENQTASATQTQEEVLEELEEMLDELENTIRNRDSALRRELASIIDSIKGLIQAQQTEIDALLAAGQGPIPGDLDERMIALVRNTLSVRDEALGAFPETRSIANLIKQAGDAQNAAINALRQEPADAGEAQRSERAALLHLNSALEEAERIDEQAAQREARRLREELRQAYREALETQTTLRDETQPLVGQRLGRRERAQARAIAESQGEIRITLDELLEQTDELGEAPIFELAHDQLDRLMDQSIDGLGGREVASSVVSAQNGALVILSSLAEVLGEGGPDQQQDFEDGASGGGQGGSQGQGDEPVIPPMAQLRLLRTMQQLAADQTRSLAESPEPDAAAVRAISDLQRRLYQQGRQLIDQMNQRPSEPVEDGGETAPMDDADGGT